MSDNPMLLNPNNPNGLSVPGIERRTSAFPIRLQDTFEYFVCTMPNHHFVRTDGKRLAFVFGVLATKDVFDIQYLESEINAGNPFLREATSDETRNYNMRIDPQGTLAKEITPAIEANMKTRLEVELRQIMEAKMNTLGVSLTQEQKDALFSYMPVAEQADLPMSNSSQENIAGIDALARLQEAIKSGTGNVSLSQPPTLQGIAGSDKTTTGIAGASN